MKIIGICLIDQIRILEFSLVHFKVNVVDIYFWQILYLYLGTSSDD